MLELQDITVSYADGDTRRRVVDDVSLVAEDGVLTCLVGPSGSGKSTLLAVAAGLTTPDSGRVLVDGRSLAGRPAELSRMRRDQVGIVFQQSNLLAGLTAIEQLLVMTHLQGRRPSSAKGRAAELLDLLGIGDLADRRPHQMSGGQRQRVAVARALMNRPRVLLADEPTSALDTERGDALVATLTELTHQQGVATLLVTHDPRHADRSDRVLRIVDGRLESSQPAPVPVS